MEPCNTERDAIEANVVEPFVRELPEPTLPLWRVQAFPDIHVDAMVCDELGQIVLLSAFGRDGAIQQLLAAFHLPRDQGGIDTVVLESATAACPSWTHRSRALIGDPKRFSKLTGKLPRGMFGQLAHVFIYDEGAVAPDHTGGSGWVLSFGASAADHQARIWGLLKQLLPLPVLDHWKVPLLEAVADQLVHMDREHGAAWPAVGCVRASLLRLDSATIADTVSKLVRDGVLTRELHLPHHDQASAVA